MRHGRVRECSQVRPGALAVRKTDRLVSARPGPPLPDACQYYCRAVPAGSPGSIGGRRENDRLARGTFEGLLHGQVPRDGGLGPGAIGRKRHSRRLQRGALLHRCRSALHLRRHVSNAEPDSRQSHYRPQRFRVARCIAAVVHVARRKLSRIRRLLCREKSQMSCVRCSPTPALNAAMALSEMHSTLLSMLFAETAGSISFRSVTKNMEFLPALPKLT